MGVNKTRTTPKRARTAGSNARKAPIPSKRDKVLRRAAKIRSIVALKKQQRVSRKAKIVPYKKKQLQAAEAEIVEAEQPVFHETSTTQQFDILKLLGLAGNTPAQSMKIQQLEDNLEKKLKDLDKDNIENPEVRRVYTEIGQIFATYRSGKIPKAFKLIPNLVKWREVITLMRPESWTPHAMYQAVRIFASNFDSDRARIFFSEYLVPAVKKDLAKNKKLNYHYYESLRKAIYKPIAWFKAVLFEFTNENATSKEIMIVESLLKQISIPCLNSCVVILKLLDMPHCSAIIHFLKALIEKKYNLPEKVVNSIYQYFLSFEKKEWDQRNSALPVIWYQALLSFVTQYGHCLDEMAKMGLQTLVSNRKHHIISAEILKQLK